MRLETGKGATAEKSLMHLNKNDTVVKNNQLKEDIHVCSTRFCVCIEVIVAKTPS